MSTDYREEETLGKAYDSRLVRRLMIYLRPYRGRVILAFLSLIAVSASQQLSPFLSKIAIDRYIMAGDPSGLDRIALAFAGLIAVSFIAEYLSQYLTGMTAQGVMSDLRIEIFSHLQRMSLSFFDRNPIGRLMTRATSDVGALNEFFEAGTLDIARGLLSIVGILGFMLYLSPKLTVIMVIIVPFLALAAYLFSTRIRGSYRETRTRLAKINSYLQENISGMDVVQLFARERANREKFTGLNRGYMDATIKTVLYFALFFPAVEAIGALSIALIILWGGWLSSGGQVTLGTLVAFIWYSERFFWPIRDLSEKYNVLQSAMAASERVFKLLDTPPAILPLPEPKRVLPMVEGIRFENVWFSYSGDSQYVLEDVSFEVKKGETVAIVGATGAGKTTIINLLGRFYEIQRGAIKIDGVDIGELDLNAHRRRMAFVAQDIFLFAGDIARNIRLGEKGISDDRVMEAARYVRAHDFVKRLPQGYRSEVKERGATLSVGQRQLLSFARALTFDPEILILDEATSSVDTETEQMIQEALRKLLSGRTAIVIAHRLSTIQNAYKIIVMHKGQVKEVGTHQELLALNGIYRRLYELQYQH